MGLGSCERCWDDVCGCGLQGYVVVGVKADDLREKLRRLGDKRLEREIVPRLSALLAELLEAAAPGDAKVPVDL